MYNKERPRNRPRNVIEEEEGEHDNFYEDSNIPFNLNVPSRPLVQDWTFIRSDQFIHRPLSKMEPFILNLDEISKVSGKTYLRSCALKIAM